MRRRTTAGPTLNVPRPRRTTEPPTTRTTAVDPAELDGGRGFPFLAQLYLPAGMYRAITLHDQTPVTELRAPDGSWCHITRHADPDCQHGVREAGPTPLARRIEQAWHRWHDLDAPPWHEFGLTATATEHHIWYQDPRTGPRWELPIPRILEPQRP